MSRKQRQLLVLYASLAITFPPFALPTDTAGSTDAELQRAVRFRAEFGLRSDIGYVAAVGGDQSAQLGWGIPLTRAEQAEMNRRRRLAAGMDDLNAYAASIPTLGAVYFDQQAGGEIVVAVAGDPSPYEVGVAARVPEGATFRMRQVDHSRAALNVLQDRITSERPALAALGVQVNAIIVDEVGNLVEVGVDRLDARARALLESRYEARMLRLFEGGRSTLTDTGCTGRGHCYGPPLRAGLHVGNNGCSTAFIVNQSGVRRILTAGHSPCGNFIGKAWTAHNASAYSFGTVQSRSWFGGDPSETADAATIGNLTAAQDDNRLYRSASTSAFINSAQIGDNANIPVCLSARMREGVRCGKLVRTDATICWDGLGCLVAQREATYEVYIGDSGGAVYDGGSMAMGVQSSCVDRT